MKTILVPLSKEESDDFAIQTGLDLARRFKAHVTFLLLRPEFDGVPLYAHSVTASGYVALMSDLKSAAEQREAGVKKQLIETAAKADIEIDIDGQSTKDAQASFAIGIGHDDDVVRRFSAVHDAIVFPRGPRESGYLEVSSLMKSALEYSGRPILVMTGAPRRDFGRTIALAWNGSTEGARAVTAALPLLSNADEVVILTVPTDKTNPQEADRLKKYLLHHGITAAAKLLHRDVPVGEQLIYAAEKAGASLLVSGGYTHSRMRQTIFGGVTHNLLENCRLPLLLAH